VGKPEGKRRLGKIRRGWEDNIKMDLQEVRCVDIDLVQDNLHKTNAAIWCNKACRQKHQTPFYILVINQSDVLLSMYLFISLLYMFRATQCSSSGESNCFNTSSDIYHSGNTSK